MQATGFKPCGGGSGGGSGSGDGRSSAVASDVTCSSKLKEGATAAARCHRGGGAGGARGTCAPPDFAN